jgi:hypothetical protein
MYAMWFSSSCGHSKHGPGAFPHANPRRPEYQAPRQRLGHSSIKVILDIYGHLLNDAKPALQRVELLMLSLGKLNG